MSQLRIREICKCLVMTIGEVAWEAGVSAPFLSQVERGRVDPSLATLREIARVLQVPIFSLFVVEEESFQVEVIRSGQETTITSPGGDLAYAKNLPPAVSLKFCWARCCRAEPRTKHHGLMPLRSALWWLRGL